MKHTDEAIDKVLAAFGDVEPPPNMQARILERMQDAARPRVRGWNWSWTLLAAALAIAIAVIGLYRVGPRAIEPTSAACCEAKLTRTTTPQTAGPRTATIGLLSPARRSHAVHRVKQTLDAASTVNAEPTHTELSLVAPPLPLTQQERLLLTLARQGAPQQFPVLDPDQLALQEAEAEARFRQLVAQGADVEQFIQMTRKNGDRR
jgi:hypothetical protein